VARAWQRESAGQQKLLRIRRLRRWQTGLSALSGHRNTADANALPDNDFIDCATPVRRVDSLGNLSQKPSLNLWMANLHARELGDDLDVLVMSDIPDICVPIMH